MWIYDGEEWREEGNPQSEAKRDVPRPRYDELVPELQVIEQLPPTATRDNWIPLFPLP